MEEVQPTGITRDSSIVDSLMIRMGLTGKSKPRSVCYVSDKKGLGTDSYSYSYQKQSNNSYEVTLSFKDPSLFNLGSTVLNQQVICFIPNGNQKIVSINLK